MCIHQFAYEAVIHRGNFSISTVISAVYLPSISYANSAVIGKPERQEREASHTVTASNHRDRSIIACSHHIYVVLFFAHIPFVVNRTFNTTPMKRLQQRYPRVFVFLMHIQ